MHVVKASPDTLDAFQTLAQIYEELGEKEKALKFMLIAAHLDDKNTEQWKLLAQKSMESNELRQAVYCLSKVLQLRPGDAECRRARADIYEMVGEGSKAIESYEELLKSNPNDVHVVHSLARCCYAAKDGKRAERVLEAVGAQAKACHQHLGAMIQVAENLWGNALGLEQATTTMATSATGI